MADGDRVLALENRRAGLLSRLMFGRYAGWAASAALQYIATTIGTLRPSSSLSRPRGSVSLMPAAHWFTVLNVAGATSTAFAGGSSSVSCGRRGLCPHSVAGDVGEAVEVEPRCRGLGGDGVQVPSVLLELSCGLLPVLDWRGGAHDPVQDSRCLWIGGHTPAGAA